MASRINQKVSAVALDFDGVIVNVEVDWKAAIKLASKIAGQEVKSLLTFYEENFGTPIFQKVSSEIEKLELEALKTSPQVHDIEETLKAFAEEKIPVYIVSMQTTKALTGYLEQHGLASYIKEVVSRERFPSKRAQVQYVTLKATGGQVLFVDDLKRNLDSCCDLGVICFLFQRTNKPKDAKEAWNKLLSSIK
jgi:phosphoglycolate phosphatase-like HAD superfamily hydrolase